MFVLRTSLERIGVEVLRLPRPRLPAFPRPVSLLPILRTEVLLLLIPDSSSSVDVSAATICKPLLAHWDSNTSSGISAFVSAAAFENVNNEDSSCSS